MHARRSLLLPTDDAPVFTMGVLPEGDEARQQLILGVAQGLDRSARGSGSAHFVTMA